MKIFLIGMMGTGKSFWAGRLSLKFRTAKYDLDHLVEVLEDKTVAEIFEEDGEEHFRKTEAKVLRWFAEKKEYILATGGGSPCFHNNMDWMNKNGITVWIDEPVELLAQRLQTEKSHRPLIKNLNDGELRSFLAKKLEQRRPFYSRAQYHLQGKRISDNDFTELIKKNA